MKAPIRRPAELMAIALAAGLAGCATTAPSARPAAEAKPPAAAKSELDLGLVGQETPALLASVGQAPYAVAAEPGCADLWSQIRALDAVLGPDVDVTPQRGRGAADAVGSLIKGMVPYRGVIRWVARADRKDRALAQAVLAGTARRGFLKGVALTRGCPAPAASASPAKPGA